MHYGDKGTTVKSLQQALLQSGYALPKHGADGQLGDETWAALHEFALDHELRWGPEVPQLTLDEILGTRGPPIIETPELADVIDMTGLRKNPPRVGSDRRVKYFVRNGRVVERDPQQIRGIVVHKTAVWFELNDRQVRKAGGDVEEALHRRSMRVGCHLVALDGKGAGMECGHALYINPLRWYVYHAQAANKYSLGLEIEGRYRGQARGQSEASERVIHAARVALAFMVKEGRRQGMPIEYIWAHRQFSPDRSGDPGEELWRRVVLEYAAPVLGLKTEPRRCWSTKKGKGRPIPESWDPDGEGAY